MKRHTAACVDAIAATTLMATGALASCSTGGGAPAADAGSKTLRVTLAIAQNNSRLTAVATKG